MHHDVLDRDFPSPPVLLTLKHDGKRVDAMAQATKQGFLFVLDRVTGKPLFAVSEMPVLQSSVAGEQTSPTQPMSSIPAPYARQHLDADHLTNRTPEAHAWALLQVLTLEPGLATMAGTFHALERLGQQTVVFPGL